MECFNHIEADVQYQSSDTRYRGGKDPVSGRLVTVPLPARRRLAPVARRAQAGSVQGRGGRLPRVTVPAPSRSSEPEPAPAPRRSPCTRSCWDGAAPAGRLRSPLGLERSTRGTDRAESGRLTAPLQGNVQAPARGPGLGQKVGPNRFGPFGSVRPVRPSRFGPAGSGQDCTGTVQCQCTAALGT